jgi:glycosyltransferase involved in cell wall biosynthesis
MRILVLEPYFTGSHAQWATGYRKHSRHHVEILQLSGANWKWRMHGGAVTLSRRFLQSSLRPDAIIATDMLDLTTFQSLTRSRTVDTPMAVYFHENQLSYPWSPTDRDVVKNRDKHYGFINYATAMAADAVFFNSQYHLDSFFEELTRLLSHFPDHNELGALDGLRRKSSVLQLGMDLRRFDEFAGGAPGNGSPRAPLILWNHRWEFDKGPEAFFNAVLELAGEGMPFRLAILGENFNQIPVVFLKARDELGDRIAQFGYVGDFGNYARWLHSADILPVTSHQDFFGASVVEAIYCGCRPLLPRRLAYPELVPDDCGESVFYDGDAQFLRLLRSILTDSRPARPRLSKSMLRFDWATMAPQYDSALERLADEAVSA